MKFGTPLYLALAIFAAPALAGVTVSSPSNGAEVSSPFSLVASAASCSSQHITSMAYSLDHNADALVVKSGSIQAQVSASAGAHTLKVKAWGSGGAVCVTDVPITVASDPVSTSGSVSVYAPAQGADVQSPFTLSASSVSCSSHQVVSMGYSLDSNTDTTTVNGESIDSQVTSTAGSHVLHVKSWSSGGGACVTDVDIAVSGSSGSSSSALSVVPSDAVKVSSIQSLSNWKGQHDTATGATSSGSMSVVNSPSLSGFARKFDFSFTDNGGQRFSDSFGDDPNPTNFFYDGWVYLPGPITTIANIEMDMNQVIDNGDTIIYAFQCDGWRGTWDYSENAGTATNQNVNWIPAKGSSCNPRNWTPNTWHHVQVWYSRDNSGNVTYHSVWFDNVEQPINETVFSEFALGWAPLLMTNFQLDGYGSSGSGAAYLDNLTVYRW
jgi:hypothetical protein